jgi:hypothetical protein
MKFPGRQFLHLLIRRGVPTPIGVANLLISLVQEGQSSGLIYKMRLAIIAVVLSALVGPAFADDVDSAAALRDRGTNLSHGMLPFNASALAAPSKRLRKQTANRRKQMQEPTAVELRRKTQSVTSSPLSSPANGASGSPVCIPAELC